MAEAALPLWYALQVRPRSERTVSAILRNKGYEPFLPACGEGAKARAMFPGYLFCRLDLRARLLPLFTTPGFHRLVGAGHAPIAVGEEEVERMRGIMKSGLASMPWPRIEPGEPVEVANGPLAGLRGVLLSIGRRSHLVVSVQLLQRSVAVELDASAVRPLSSSFFMR
jgi:transcriptional antiterminator RfaH